MVPRSETGIWCLSPVLSSMMVRDPCTLGGGGMWAETAQSSMIGEASNDPDAVTDKWEVRTANRPRAASVADDVVVELEVDIASSLWLWLWRWLWLWLGEILERVIVPGTYFIHLFIGERIQFCFFPRGWTQISKT
uniref:Citrate synthase n=1 Tax=Rhizophora mucronata TaxID=61149 RepID=A0A2P2JIP0_RHIMU